MTRIRSRLPDFSIPGSGIPQRAAVENPVTVSGGAPAQALAAAAAARATVPGWAGAGGFYKTGGPTGGDWIPATSNVNAAQAANLAVFVLYQGGGTGTLYSSGAVPHLVTVLSTQQGGPTGMLVQIEKGLAKAANPVAPYGQDQATADTGSPTMCCYDTDAQVLNCDDGSTIGIDQVISQVTDAQGNPLWVVQTQDGQQLTVAACTQTPPGGGGDGGDETPTNCCYDNQTGTLNCDDGSSIAAQVVNQIQDAQGNALVIVAVGDQQLTVPLCSAPPPPPPGGGGGRCCYDKAMSMLVCDPGDPRDGMTVTLLNSFVQPDGTPIAVVQLSDGSALDATICATPPGMCCYDVATGTLRCPKNAGLNGQQVSLIAMTQQGDGSILAIVQIQGQESVTTYPICDDQIGDCCYDGDGKKIICSDPAMTGTEAGIVASWTDPQGQIWVWAAWPGGGARMPLCPGKTCPPAFCCVNVETMRYVCPGQLDRNGQAAQVVNIVTEDGFNWGVLADGSRVPLCGRDCPPPEICPQCPTCPADLWMSPDGQCVPPPPCQPPVSPCAPYPGAVPSLGVAAVRTTRARNPGGAPPAMQRVRGKPINRMKNPCCDSCAKGNPCTGCAKSPRGNPMTRQISMNYGRVRPRGFSRRRRIAL